ncbi:hypothetical protein Tco_0296597 [Tanacetum coccineum]
MAPKRATRSTRAPPTPNETTTTVTEAQLQALIDQGVAAAMAEAEASRGSGPRPAQTARECSYSEFLKCKPLDFKGTEGVVGLTRWFEKMESVFSISNCPATSQVKFATCTLQDDALTWGEIKKIETEMMGNLKVKGTMWWPISTISATSVLMRFQMFPEEVDKIEKYIGGLPDMILGSVKASKSKTMQEAIEFTTELMDDKTQAYAERQAERKIKNDDLSKNNQNQQNKRQNTSQAYTAGNSGRKSYVGSKPLIVGADLPMPTTTTTTTTVTTTTTTTTITTTTTTVTTTTTTTTVTTTTIISRAMVALSAELKAILKVTAQD